MSTTQTSPSFKIAIDPRKGLLRLTFTGLWTEATVDRFEHELNIERDRMERHGLSPDWISVLVDARDFPVQTKDVAARLQARVAKYHADRRIAFLVPSSQLQAMQIKRVASIEHTAMFSNEADALGWLNEMPAQHVL